VRKSGLILIGFWALGACGGLARSAEPTNVLLIMTDDQGAWSLGCYGDSDAATPTIDTLASEGVRFTRAFATSPVCSPSRATYYTGRIPSQHGIHDWIKHENDGPRARFCLPDEVLLSAVLKANGYTCGLSGKWHLGDNGTRPPSYDFWFAMPTGGSAYQDAEMYWQGRKIRTEGYLTDRITDKAIEFLDTAGDGPFFLNVQYNAPHSPYTGHPAELLDLYRDSSFESIPRLPAHPWSIRTPAQLANRDNLVAYFAACTGVDRGVARILERLE